RDHVHLTAGMGGRDKFGWSGSGGGIGAIGPSLADQIWTGAGAAPEGWKEGAIQGAIRGFLQGLGPLGQLAGGLASSFPGLEKLLPDRLGIPGSGVVSEALQKFVGDRYEGWIKDWVYSTFGSMGGGSVAGGAAAGGSGLAEWARSGLAYGGAFPATGANVQKMVTLGTKESGGDERAVNPTSVDGEHASGAWQMLPSTFNAHKVNPGDDILRGEHNAAASSRYQKSRYGRLVTFSPYEKGGLIPGTPGDPRVLMAHAGEIVLPRGVADSFVRFAESLNAFVKSTRSPRAGIAAGPSSASQNIRPGSLGSVRQTNGGNFSFRQHNAVSSGSPGSPGASLGHRGGAGRFAAPVDGVRSFARDSLLAAGAMRTDRLEAGVEGLRREVAHQTNVVGSLLESIPPETGREVRGGMIDGLKGGDADLQRAARYAVEDRGVYSRMAE
ncbi:MAG: transglycosylase SLT domain-containing protein, partial [Actinomycetota bacterium]|nr:transglycosylase SLT domain-containing protein [Actinomycetota bacterium]